MGDNVFFRTLREYIRRYKNAYVTFVDFVSVCNDVSGRDWMPFFYQWCYGKACPAYHLVGFESKESQAGWETTVTIRNSGVGIIRCPLELQMDGQSQEEVFWVPEGRERKLVYQTAKKVTGVAIDPERTTYQVDLAAKKEDPAYFVNSLGHGRKSNQEIVSKYSQEWLHQIADPWVLCKTGMALYDMERYEDALAAFEKMGQEADENRVRQATALIWQGHMLDLLDRRDEAISRYQKVVDMDTKQEIYMRHDQFGLAYHPSPYASKRINTPFTRVENQLDD
jgi:tetratricopeptide (TPR) repeat protein